jgi:hypothetical protein
VPGAVFPENRHGLMLWSTLAISLAFSLIETKGNSSSTIV